MYILPFALQLLISFVIIHEFFYSFFDEVIPLQFYSSFRLSISICFACCLKYLFIHNWRLAVDILNHLEMNSQFLFSSSYSLLIISKLSINLLKQLSFPFNISFFQFYFDFVYQETGQPHLQPGLIYKSCLAFGFCENQKAWLI